MFFEISAILISVIMLFFARPLGSDKDVFDRETTASLRGMCMLWIILHHIRMSLPYYESPSKFLFYLGAWATGLFFLISGYGNTFSLSKKNSCSVRWIVQKALKLYLPFLFMYAVVIIGYAVFAPEKIQPLTRNIKNLCLLSLPGRENWFPKVIMLCFILHWAVNWLISKLRLKAAAIQPILLFALFFCYAVIVYKRGMNQHYYNSVFCYPIGCLLAVGRNRISSLLQKKKTKIMLLIALCLCFAAVFPFLEAGVKYRMIEVILFALICYLFSALFGVKTRILKWIGNNSFEFYLGHLACISVIGVFGIPLWSVRIALVLPCCFLLVYVYKKLYALIAGYVTK